MDRKRSGRPSKLTPKIKKIINHAILVKPDSTAEEICEILPKMSKVRLRSIRRYRKALGFTASKGKPFEVLTDQQKEDRVKYCLEHEADRFSNVLFMDEKTFEIFKHRRKVWRKKDEQSVRRRTTKYPPKIQIWGGISKLGKTSLVFWRNRGKSTYYQKRIQEPLKQFQKKIGKKKFRFQHDQDTTHTSRSTNQ